MHWCIYYVMHRCKSTVYTPQESNLCVCSNKHFNTEKICAQNWHNTYNKVRNKLQTKFTRRLQSEIQNQNKTHQNSYQNDKNERMNKWIVQNGEHTIRKRKKKEKQQQKIKRRGFNVEFVLLSLSSVCLSGRSAKHNWIGMDVRATTQSLQYFIFFFCLAHHAYKFTHIGQSYTSAVGSPIRQIVFLLLLVFYQVLASQTSQPFCWKNHAVEILPSGLIRKCNEEKKNYSLYKRCEQKIIVSFLFRYCWDAKAFRIIFHISLFFKFKVCLCRYVEKTSIWRMVTTFIFSFGLFLMSRCSQLHFMWKVKKIVISIRSIV